MCGGQDNATFFYLAGQTTIKLYVWTEVHKKLAYFSLGYMPSYFQGSHLSAAYYSIRLLALCIITCSLAFIC